MLKKISNTIIKVFSKFSISFFLNLLKQSAVTDDKELNQNSYGGFLLQDWENIGKDLKKSINEFEKTI